MKNQLFSFLLIIWFVFSVSAQTNEARKIYEFGNTNCDNYRASLDILLTELNHFPDSKGYVFVYEGDLETVVYDKNGVNKGKKLISSEKGFAKRLIGYFKNHLLFRNFPSERIVFVEAGFRKKITNELWIVPNGANLPTPTPTLQKIKQRKHKPGQFGFCEEM
jgi:hypothetical protein